MKPFNLEKALAGYPLVTRSGLKVDQIAYFPNATLSKIIALIDGILYPYNIDGTKIPDLFDDHLGSYDLLMPLKTKKLYIGIKKIRRDEHDVGGYHETTVAHEDIEFLYSHIPWSKNDYDIVEIEVEIELKKWIKWTC
jgi:hypothetical protein